MKNYSKRDAVRHFREKLKFTTGPAELSRMIKDHEEVNIIDVRRPEDYAKSHIPGAVNLPREQWPTLAGLNPNRLNAVYCYSQQCHLATEACLEFARHGFPVLELEGGFQTWQEHDLEVEGEEALRKAA